MKILKALLALSVVGLVVVFGLTKFKGKPKEVDLEIKLPDKIIEIDNNRIGFTGSTDCEKNPVVYLETPDKKKQEYEIKIEDSCVDNEKFISVDIDNDGQAEVISEWVGHYFGSGGLKSLVIFKVEKNQLKPILGYPQSINDIVTDKNLTVRNLSDDKVENFPVGGMSSITEYGSAYPNELRYASYIWGKDECHSCPHRWQLESYIFENGFWIKNKNWNREKTYVTTEKIEDNEILNRIKEIFDTKNNM